MNRVLATVAVVFLVFGIGYFIFRIPADKGNDRPIRIGVVIYPGDGIFFISEEKGFFKEEGVNVELVTIVPDNAGQLLASGDIDLLYMSNDFLAILADAGVRAKQVIAPTMSYGADGVLVPKEIRSIEELKEKKVYLGFGYPSHLFFRYAAEHAGLSRDDVELVHMLPEDVGASFAAGRIDAGVTWEPWLSKASERSDGKVLFTSREFPDVLVDGVIVRDDVLAERRGDVLRVLRGIFKAIDWWEAHPEEGNAITAQRLGLSADEFAAMRGTIKLIDKQQNIEKFDASKPLNLYFLARLAARIYREDGVISKNVDTDSMLDASLLGEI